MSGAFYLQVLTKALQEQYPEAKMLGRARRWEAWRGRTSPGDIIATVSADGSPTRSTGPDDKRDSPPVHAGGLSALLPIVDVDNLDGGVTGVLTSRSGDKSSRGENQFRVVQ